MRLLAVGGGGGRAAVQPGIVHTNMRMLCPCQGVAHAKGLLQVESTQGVILWTGGP